MGDLTEGLKLVPPLAMGGKKKKIRLNVKVTPEEKKESLKVITLDFPETCFSYARMRREVDQGDLEVSLKWLDDEFGLWAFIEDIGFNRDDLRCTPCHEGKVFH